jgi:two-component system response regulator ChvI
MLSPSMTKTERDVASPTTDGSAPLPVDGQAQAIRVFLIENDTTYREMLTDRLSAQGFAVRSFEDSASLFGVLNAGGNADVILVNWNLPNVSGIDLLVKLRKRGIRVPVLLLAGDPLQSDECLAFDEGARDFIDKSRGVDILIGRLKVATRNFERQQDVKTISCGKLLLQTDISRASWDQVDLDLTLGEYRTVHLLASNPGQYVTYRAVYDRMHYEGFVAGVGEDGYRANVRSAIKRIRNKFRALDPTFDQIENYPSFGYCWKRPD